MHILILLKHSITSINSHDLIILDLQMPKMVGMTLYKKKEIDNKIIICFTTTDINYSEDLHKGIIDIDKIVLYKPVLLKDLKNKIDSLLLLSQKEENNKSNMKILDILIYLPQSKTRRTFLIVIIIYEENQKTIIILKFILFCNDTCV